MVGGLMPCTCAKQSVKIKYSKFSAGDSVHKVLQLSLMLGINQEKQSIIGRPQQIDYPLHFDFSVEKCVF